MGDHKMSDWKPNLYLTFEKERTQPSIDLVTRIENDNPKRIIDIGCGPGNSTNVLKSRWPYAEIIGMDKSQAMIEQARKKYENIDWICADASHNLSNVGQFDIVFSNAAMQWIPDQHLLLPNLFSIVRINGVMAVQVPCTQNMPIHTELEKLISTSKWEGHFMSLASTYSIHTADFYYGVVSRLTPQIDLWQTDYYHTMNSHQDIVKWYSGSGLRPYLDCLSDDALKTEFMSDYENMLKNSYPLQKDNKVLFPFTRIFFIAYKAE